MRQISVGMTLLAFLIEHQHGPFGTMYETITDSAGCMELLHLFGLDVRECATREVGGLGVSTHIGTRRPAFYSRRLGYYPIRHARLHTDSISQSHP